MHHATKKSLIARYTEMRESGATDTEIRAEMENDPKIESAEDAEAILAELPEASGSKPDPEKSNDADKASAKKKKGSYIVVKEFRDARSFSKVHAVGSDVSSFDQERLDRLVSRGIVEKK
jgi:hypothetical protein